MAQLSLILLNDERLICISVLKYHPPYTLFNLMQEMHKTRAEEFAQSFNRLFDDDDDDVMMMMSLVHCSLMVHGLYTHSKDQVCI